MTADLYETWVRRVADALHEDCRLKWQAIAVADPTRQVTQHFADAHYGQAHDLVRRLAIASTPEPAPVAEGLPPGTRLILASENLLLHFGARTEEGYRITAEWGEQQPGGWYEPTFTVHYDQPFAALRPTQEEVR